MQALYHCEPFRECIQFYKPKDTIPILIEEEKYRRLFYKSKSTSTLNSKKNKFSKKINTQQTSSSSPNDNTSASLSPNLKPISSNLSISSISSTNNGGSLNTISSTDQKPPKLSKRSKKEIVTETLKIVKEFEAEESLLWELKSLFLQITTNKKKQGSVAPKRFIDVLQKKNGIYFILFYFILFYFILFYFILFYFILFYFILFYFILFYFIYYLKVSMLNIETFNPELIEYIQ